MVPASEFAMNTRRLSRRHFEPAVFLGKPKSGSRQGGVSSVLARS